MAFDDRDIPRARHSGDIGRTSGGGWLRRGRSAVFRLAMVVFLGFGAANGFAQSREVLIGSTRIGPGSESDADRATSMLDQGIRAVERGDVMLGRQILETLVRRYPETLAASAARGTLQELPRTGRSAGARDEPGPAPGWLPVQSRDSQTDRGLETLLPSSREPAAARSREQNSALAAEQLRRLQDERRYKALSEQFQNATGDRVFFSEMGVELGARARTVLAAQARWLISNGDVVAVVEAHADDTGQREPDFLLAERRAEAVKARLIEEGVPAGRLQVRVHGRDQPIAICSYPECKAQNRRVITRIGATAESDTARGRMPPDGTLALTPDQARGAGRRDR